MAHVEDVCHFNVYVYVCVLSLCMVVLKVFMLYTKKLLYPILYDFTKMYNKNAQTHSFTALIAIILANYFDSTLGSNLQHFWFTFISHLKPPLL